MKLPLFTAPALLCSTFVSFTSLAAAEEAEDSGAAEAAAASDSEDPPKIHFAPQAPPRGNRRTFHRHDGFYLRTNLGASLLWANIDDGEDFIVDADGTAMALDLLIGGSPSPGISIGGGVISNWSFGAEFEREGDTVPDRDVQDFTVGAFVDGFPNDTGPWHFGALVGFSSVMVNQDFVDNTAGIGGAIWTGYDQWVADDWALGGQLRFTINTTRASSEGVDYSANAATLGLMFSVLYH